MKKLELLAEAVKALPNEYQIKIAPLLVPFLEEHLKNRVLMGKVQEALSQLQVDVKYLMFDLEATRRERDTLRKMDL